MATLNIKPKLRRNSFFTTQSFYLILVLIVLFIIATTGNPNFLTYENIISVLEQVSVLGVISAGVTILMIAGNFDISLGAMAGLTCCIMARLINLGVNEGLASVIGIAFAIGFSSTNGSLSIAFMAPSFIISLATTGIFWGISLMITQGALESIYGQFEFLSRAKLFGTLPLVFIISVVVYIAVHLMLRYTQIGRRVYAIGSNPRASFLSGISVEKNKMLFFVINGFLVGIASNMLLSRLGGAVPATGSGLEMRAISAVVVGGVPISGGRGTILGTILGVLIMGIISNMLNLLRVNMYLQDILYGCIVLFAIGISSVRMRLGYK